jgi:nicotinate-nucleotide adenylyltransferase
VRIGVFGGSFDPPHVGHLLVATDAMERLALDRVVFVPAATQPLKAGGPRTAGAARLAMVRALVGDDARFVVDPIEIDRGGLSFTVDTLEALCARWPAAELVLLAGADVLATFRQWRAPERVRSLATLVVLARAVGGEHGPLSVPAVPPDFPGGPPEVLQTRRVDVSSTEVRARLAAGRSIRGFVPDGVADLIRSAGLYR